MRESSQPARAIRSAHGHAVNRPSSMTPRPTTPWHSSPRARLTFHQEIQDAVAARERLVLVVGPKSRPVGLRAAAGSGDPRRARAERSAVRAPGRLGGHSEPVARR
jgi:hypothetical protein